MGFNFIAKYLVETTTKSDDGRRTAIIGASSTVIVVFFVSFLVAAIYDSNFLFLKLAENQASEADFILLPRPSNRSTSPFLNFTAITEKLRATNDPLLEVDGGTAARWLAVAELSNTQDATKTTTATVLIVDTDRETQVKMGRLFNKDYRKMGKQEAYFSNTICASLGVPAQQGQRITMKIDLLSLAGSLLGGESVTTANGITISLSEALKDQTLLKLYLTQSLGIDFAAPVEIPTQSLTNDLIVQSQSTDQSGNANAQLLAGILTAVSPIIPATVTATVGQLFDAMYPTLIQALVIEEEFVALKEIASPNGKYPSGIGNVMLMELDDAHRLLRRTFAEIRTLVDPFVAPFTSNTTTTTTTTNTTTGANSSTNVLVVAYESLVQASSLDLHNYAMQVSVQVRDRRTMYATDSDTMQAMVTNISDRLAMARPANTTVTVITPVAAAVGAFQFIRLFLDNIFNSMIFLLTLLGSLVIYSLMLGNVETKTYEYGMLRALGMPYKTLTQLLYSQAFMYAACGVVIGMSLAGLFHLPLAAYFASFSGLAIDYRLPDFAIVFGVAIGIVMPLVANYAPVRRALSNTLRDALDMYRKAANEINVKLQKLADMGLSPGLSAFAFMLFLIGITTFYFLPLSFVFGQFGLFLGILNSILLGILLGLSLLSQMIQPLIEQVLLRIVFATCSSKRDQCLQPIIRKNLFGHRSRNRKVSYVLTISVAFLIFAGALFSLQTRVIGISVSQLLGADISMSSFRAGSEKDENGRPILIGLPEQELNQVLNQTGIGVDSWTYVTYSMNTFPFIQEVRVGPASMSPNRRSSVFGLTTNFLDVAYGDYVVTTSRNQLGPGLSSTNVVREMIEGQGKLRLVGETSTKASNDATTAKLSVVSSIKGVLPTCATAAEFSYVFLKCDQDDEVITSVNFANFGIPSGVCNDVDGTNTFEASAQCDAGEYVQQYFSARCIGRSSCGASATTVLFGDPCPGTAKRLSIDVSCGKRSSINLEDAVSLEPPPVKYIDAVISQALTDYCSININTPFGLRLTTGYTLPGAKSYLMNVIGKPRAFVSKAPAFLFSSYQILAQRAPLLIPLEQYTSLVFKAYDLAQNFESDASPQSSQQETAAGATTTATTAATTTTQTGNSSVNLAKNETQERYDTLKRVGKNPFQSGFDVPKERLLIRMQPSSTLLQKAVLINNLMARSGSGTASQFSSSVTDTKGLIKETEVATTALNFFLIFISIIIMSLVMLVSSVSFSANVNENAREFAVLRSLGLLRSQTVMVWLLEAVSLTCSSFLLGTMIGLLVASSLTLTQGLFLEIPFFLVLPTGLLFVLFILSVIVALVASFQPAKLLLQKPIAGVLKG